MKSIYLLLFFFVFSPLFAEGKTNLLFSDMENGDEIVVKYSSQGCFHSYSYQLNFKRENGNTHVTIKYPTEEAVDKALPLTPRDITRLDKLFFHYRNRNNFGCTTSTSSKVSYREAGKEIASDEFVDGSCSDFSKMGILSFEMIERAAKPIKEIETKE